jgi:hypothetical protein
MIVGAATSIQNKRCHRAIVIYHRIRLREKPGIGEIEKHALRNTIVNEYYRVIEIRACVKHPPDIRNLAKIIY